MARPILLDTNVIVDFFRGYVKAEAFINTNNARIILSSIVVAELYAGVKGDAEQATLQEFVSLFRVAPVSAEIGKIGGLYKRDYGKSHGVGLADAILAATAEGRECRVKNPQHQTLSYVKRPQTGLPEVKGQHGI